MQRSRVLDDKKPKLTGCEGLEVGVGDKKKSLEEPEADFEPRTKPTKRGLGEQAEEGP